MFYITQTLIELLLCGSYENLEILKLMGRQKITFMQLFNKNVVWNLIILYLVQRYHWFNIIA